MVVEKLNHGLFFLFLGLLLHPQKLFSLADHGCLLSCPQGFLSFVQQQLGGGPGLQLLGVLGSLLGVVPPGSFHEVLLTLTMKLLHNLNCGLLAHLAQLQLLINESFLLFGAHDLIFLIVGVHGR